MFSVQCYEFSKPKTALLIAPEGVKLNPVKIYSEDFFHQLILYTLIGVMMSRTELIFMTVILVIGVFIIVHLLLS